MSVEESLRAWLASAEGQEALARTLDDLESCLAELREDRRLDGRAIERPCTI